MVTADDNGYQRASPDNSTAARKNLPGNRAPPRASASSPPGSWPAWRQGNARGPGPRQVRVIVEQIKSQTHSSNVDSLVADLSSLRQIRVLARQFRERRDRLDVLINNAGGLWLERRLTEDGLEMTFAVNHLAYFLVTKLPAPLLEASARRGSSTSPRKPTAAPGSISTTCKARKATPAGRPTADQSWRTCYSPASWPAACKNGRDGKRAAPRLGSHRLRRQQRLERSALAARGQLVRTDPGTGSADGHLPRQLSRGPGPLRPVLRQRARSNIIRRVVRRGRGPALVGPERRIDRGDGGTLIAARPGPRVPGCQARHTSWHSTRLVETTLPQALMADAYPCASVLPWRAVHNSPQSSLQRCGARR